MSITSGLYRGSCFCGAVSYTVTGKPILSAFCHCTLCQRLNSAPLIHTLHFPAAAFSWAHAEPCEALLDSYALLVKPWKTRWRCKSCGGCVASYNSKTEKYSIWGAQLDRNGEGKIVGWEELKPTAHIFYTTRMVDVDDELGKWEGYENCSKRLD